MASVAMVKTDVFQKKLNYEPGKFTKIMTIFVEIECIEHQGVIFGLKRIGQLFPTLWSSHEI